ncbi:aspartate--tRNA ligase [Meiothermus ruber]|jgi:aspartyl-tRNA synthetase|uniref:Aspartate--tRNA ligase n=1 Tax=Meiothermus ruber (strain ATCC 35948 / DSM 1279 / VKM B-1258 / 21) TaxID=504728 RepID=D3PS88_MEIRD|nr:aspartate--tRNA ligase [Meiothermus ruber]GIW39059.1 MAG: aspartate--tRNA(Asp) ligase [Meiothermus sp.]ADD28321.1 aspartyl-tRNA synthetase [Meiothermus ruber DSM 1279]AGK06239.1 aspartyl-tRNA ligase [Meiothermus ruber DSM 1279]MCL6529075.1 aspartate--tRNA ligase [Meiothermus ruber]GAO75276.1 aspartyl-tRNA synthetase [Meiothermus ruber H328]
MRRTLYCGELREHHAGQTVVLEGWVNRRRNLGGLIFIDLRDREGLAQVVVNPEAACFSEADRVRAEWVIRVEGSVRLRPADQLNAKLATGAVEVIAERIEVLAEAKTPPFPIDAGWRGEDDPHVGEEVRLRNRVVDLRRRRLHHNLRLRHKVVAAIYRFLDAHGFISVETPYLTRSTPEGARDFLVPSRLEPGHFYALPQSPQLFKQMLMVAGYDRYFQIARCFRDEDLRADRQPDFTQLDMEMSFVTQEDIIALNEELAAFILRETLGQEPPLPFPRLTYTEVMNRYGSDKPDLRFGLELQDVTEAFRGGEFRAFAGAEVVKALVVPGLLSRREIEALEATAKTKGAAGLAWARFENGALSGGIARYIPAHLPEQLGLTEGHTLLLVAGPWRKTVESLGAVRLELGRQLGLIEPGFKFLWVVDFPLLEWDEEAGRWTYMHHPFTSPNLEDLHLLDTDPGRVRAYAYDFVLNGSEIGGGSIRIHRRDLQERMFALLGIGPEEAQQKFGFLLEALSYGAPPHGGIAWGLDRFVAHLAGEESIREVIAFPKNKEGKETLTGAPAPVDEAQLAAVGLAVRSEV